ncbi:MAG: hypothetical protein MUD11_14320 [Rhodobacteraceae bacterium]|jgi:hypothetical protein|nr:hypothetical protein [Paracoccaceae bacterium]
MAAHDFHIVTTWLIEGQISEIAAILTDALALPDWWGDVYLSTAITAAGDDRGIGRKVAVHSKGRLPYSIRFTAELVSANLPHRWDIAATGDLTGQGVWRLEQQEGVALVTYDWRVAADRPLFRRLAPIMRPVFAWNHRWAMARGEAALRRELIRRTGRMTA